MSKILDYIKGKYEINITDNKTLGLSVVKCKEIALLLAKINPDLFLLDDVYYFEEKLIQGLIIGYAKFDFSLTVNYLKEFVKKIDHWAICDSTVANLKIFKKNLDQGLEFIEYCFNQFNPYTIRFAYVLLLSYYLDEKYLDYIFQKIRNENSNEYYVKMAVAWLISYLYIKFPNETIRLFDGTLDKFINNKALSKINV